MGHAELRVRLRPILEAEERGEWPLVDQLADELDRELASGRFENSPEIVNHYLNDADIRQTDMSYGNSQRQQVRRFIETGKFPRSVGLPWWSCATVASIGIALLAWIVA